MSDYITYFRNEGAENTESVVALALGAAQDLGIRHVVIATTKGRTALLFKEQRDLNVVAVGQAWGFKAPGENSLTPEVRTELEAGGVTIHTSAHVLSGAERGLSAAFQGVYPVQIVAQALKFFGQGTKVAVEVATAALDAGLIPYGRPVIAIGGSKGGADTALVLTPSYSASILETKIHRVIAKPLLEKS